MENYRTAISITVTLYQIFGTDIFQYFWLVIEKSTKFISDVRALLINTFEKLHLINTKANLRFPQNLNWSFLWDIS